MRDAAFQELLNSLRQAGQIRRAARRPSRTTTCCPTDVQAVRAKLGTSQAEFKLMIGVSVATLRNWDAPRCLCHHAAESRGSFRRLGRRKKHGASSDHIGY